MDYRSAISSPSGFLPSTVNDLGQVAYVANMSGGSGGRALIRYDSGGTSAIVAKQTTSFMGSTLSDIHNKPSINNSGAIAFRTRVGDSDAIFSTNTGKITAVGDSVSGSTVSFITQTPVINNSGSVGYTVSLVSGTRAMRDSTPLIGPSQTLPDATNVLILHSSITSINDSGKIATEGRNSVGQGVIVSQNERLARTGLTYGGLVWSGNSVGATAPIINNDDEIAWVDTTSGIGNALYRTFGFSAHQSETIDGKTISSFSSHDLNNHNQLAYTTLLTVGGQSLFVNGDNIIATGDTIEGRTVRTFNGVSINDNGQIAFFALLDGGVNPAVILATPVPEPNSVLICGSGLVSILRLRHNHRRQRPLTRAPNSCVNRAT